jgi:ribosomal protein L11 methylase PrmA
VDIAYANARLNQIAADRYRVTSGDILSDEPLRRQIREWPGQWLRQPPGQRPDHAGRYDIAAANIVADTVIGLADFVPSCLRKGGVFIASGVIRERLDDVAAALTEKGLMPVDTLAQEDWFCLVTRYA